MALNLSHISDLTTENSALEVLRAWGLLGRVKSAVRAVAPSMQEKALEALERYNVVLNTRFRTCAGMVKYNHKIIELNPKLLEAGRKQERNETMLHEVCHVLAYVLFRHSGHGEEWVTLMEHIGIKKVSRFHRYQFLRSNIARRFVYTCTDCGSIMKRTRKMHKPGELKRWYHMPCHHAENRGRFTFEHHHHA